MSHNMYYVNLPMRKERQDAAKPACATAPAPSRIDGDGGPVRCLAQGEPDRNHEPDGGRLVTAARRLESPGTNRLEGGLVEVSDRVLDHDVGHGSIRCHEGPHDDLAGRLHRLCDERIPAPAHVRRST